MGSLDFLKSRALAMKGVVQVARTDTPVAIRLRALQAAGAVTSVTIDNSTDLEIITANGGTDTYTFAANTTVGALVDAVNADLMFEARVLDSLRSYATDDQFVDGAISAGIVDNVSYYDVLVDTSAALYIATRVAKDRHVGENMVKAGNTRIHLKQIQYYADFGTAAADSIQVWSVEGSNETQLFGYISVDTTETTHSWASGKDWVTLPEGAELVVLMKDAGTLADDTSDFLEVAAFVE